MERDDLDQYVAESDELRAWAAAAMPELPDGYIVKQLKRGGWSGKSPHGDFDVKAGERDEVVFWLRLNAISHAREAAAAVCVPSV